MNGIRWREVVSHNDHLSFQILYLPELPSREVTEDPVHDIFDVLFPIFEILVFDRIEGIGELVQGHLEGPLGVDMLLFDHLDGFIAHHAVFRQLEVDIKDVGVLSKPFFQDPLFDLLKLFLRLHDSRFEPHDLEGHLLRRNLTGNEGDALALQGCGLPRDNPRGNPDTLQGLLRAVRRRVLFHRIFLRSVYLVP